MFNTAMMTSKTNEWATPQKVFDELNKEFNFTLDPAATKDNAKCSKFYTQETDGLAHSWAGEIVFCNPPYGKAIGEWVKKCYEEWKENNITAVLLIPSRTDTKYFHDYIYNRAELRFIRGRLKFVNFGVEGGSAPFPSMIAIFRKREEQGDRI